MDLRLTRASTGFSFALFLLSALLLLSVPSSAAAQSLTNHDIPRVSVSPRIDGQIDDGEWAQAMRVAMNIETGPRDNVTADVEAEALLMEDGEVLYVAFIAHDHDPEQIRAVYRDRIPSGMTIGLPSC